MTQAQESKELGKKFTILVVEDNPISQRLMTAILNSLNCKVGVAGSGKQALDLIKKTSFDLIIMDIGLPDLSGFDVTSTIRKNEYNKSHIPIIGLSAHSTLRLPALKSGMDDYFLKPLTGELFKTISQKYLIEY